MKKLDDRPAASEAAGEAQFGCASCGADLTPEDVAANDPNPGGPTDGLACLRCVTEAAGIAEVAEARGVDRTGSDVIAEVADEPWTGPMLVHYILDSRAIGPFGDAGEAIRWLRAVPNSLFDTAAGLEAARESGDLFLTALEPPDSPRRIPRVTPGDEWEEDWGRVAVPPEVLAEARAIEESHATGSEADAGFDGGEFSSRSHALAMAAALERLAERHGLTLEQLESALEADEGDKMMRGEGEYPEGSGG